MGGQLKDVFIKWPNIGHRINGLNIWRSECQKICYSRYFAIKCVSVVRRGDVEHHKYFVFGYNDDDDTIFRFSQGAGLLVTEEADNG